MTKIEWEQTWEVLSGLWSGIASKLSDEEQASYRRVLSDFGVDDARAGLRAWKDMRGKFPMPSEIRKFISENQKSSNMSREQVQVTWHESMRRAWIKADPSRTGEFENMTDMDVEIAYAHYEWEAAEAVYGETSTTPAAKWHRWQCLLIKSGHRDSEPVKGEYELATQHIDRGSIYNRLFRGA